MNVCASCEVYSVPHRQAVRWKWRYVGRDGRMVVAAEYYERLLECVRAARAQGYEPRAQWTACVRSAAQDDAQAERALA